MRSLGATSCLDYTAGDVAGQAVALAGGQVDAIADLVGGPHAAAALGALRTGGQIASIATPDLDIDPLIDANITFHGVLIGDDGARTRSLATRLGDGSLRVVISHELPLSEAAAAHAIVEEGHAGGQDRADRPLTPPTAGCCRAGRGRARRGGDRLGERLPGLGRLDRPRR